MKTVSVPPPAPEEVDLVALLRETRTELTPQLVAATEKLNAKIFEFQVGLSELKLGVSASIPLDESADGRFSTYLTWEKWGGTWCLTVRQRARTG